MTTNNQLDERKLKKMKYLILKLEDENSKTKKYNYGQMVEKIKNIIIDTLKERNFWLEG